MKFNEKVAEWWWMVRWSSRATAALHVCAMWAPFNSWRIFFYRLRGVKIGKDVYIVQSAFLEESRPWLIEIHDRVRIGIGVIIVTHDAVYTEYDNSIPYRYGKVILKRQASICPGSIILPGVTIGERSVVAPGSLVNKDVPDGVIVAGRPAKFLMTLEDGLENRRKDIDVALSIDKTTKYPWKIDYSI